MLRMKEVSFDETGGGVAVDVDEVIADGLGAMLLMLIGFIGGLVVGMFEGEATMSGSSISESTATSVNVVVGGSRKRTVRNVS